MQGTIITLIYQIASIYIQNFLLFQNDKQTVRNADYLFYDFESFFHLVRFRPGIAFNVWPKSVLRGCD